ncbi:MAG: phosphodiester glycosidase family protein [Acidobacteriota bacterium]
MPRAILRPAAAMALAAVVAACPAETRLKLPKGEQIADGVQLFLLNDTGLVGGTGPVAVQILRIDPARTDLQIALAQDRVMALETVERIAARHDAIAAVNAGFFVVRNGDPVGVLEIDNELVSDSTLFRGAVGIVREPGRRTRLIFDRVSADVALEYTLDDGRVMVPINGVDTTRARGQTMLYTPRLGPDSDTAATGVEWQLGGSPLRVLKRRADAGKTPIPPDGAVLSYGGTVLPGGLERLREGQQVTIRTRFQAMLGTLPEQWEEADDIVSGAGLLIHRGTAMSDWSDERLREGFATERHPRTMIGVNRSGIIWLVTADGRSPQVSVGMTFTDLQRLAEGLNLYSALNLDGGGSTTMVVRGRIVNHPSDTTGPRNVSDALLVVPLRNPQS